MDGEDPATWSPSSKQSTYGDDSTELDGEDPATWSPSKQSTYGEDPTTWSPTVESITYNDEDPVDWNDEFNTVDE